jgi:serine protease AprX
VSLSKHRQTPSELGEPTPHVWRSPSPIRALKKSWRALALSGFAAVALVAPVAPVNASNGSQSADGKAVVEPLLQQLASQKPDQNLPVLVVRKSSNSSTVQAHGGRVRHQPKTANLVAADLPASKLAELANDPDVVRVSYDTPVHATDYSAPLSGSELKTTYPLVVGGPTAWSYNFRGTGVGVAVLDSGISLNHPDFLGTRRWFGVESSGSAPRVVKSVAISQENHGSADDDYGHGTWVAGIIGGRGWSDLSSTVDNNQYVGIAPDVNLINVKVNGRDGEAYTSDVIAGLEWIVENQAIYNIKVANLSLVSSTAESYSTSYLDAAVEMAWFSGITVVVSAGNTGPNTMLYAPANDPYVIVVGATDNNGTAAIGDDQVATFSSYGTTQDGFSKPDVVAPGRHIVGPLASTSIPLAQQFPAAVVNSRYISLSGTSAAAPVVTGAIADILQYATSRGINLTPDQVKWVLKRSATPVAGSGAGAGYPNLVSAGQLLYSPTTIGRANESLAPSQLLLAAYGASTGTTWNNVSWNNVSWNNVSWNNVSWNNVSWNNVSWNNVAGD